MGLKKKTAIVVFFMFTVITQDVSTAAVPSSVKSGIKNLYDGLKDMYSYYQQNVSGSRNTLEQSIAAVDVLENELNKS